MATAVFPVVLNIMPQHIFNAKDPIIVGKGVVWYCCWYFPCMVFDQFRM